LNLILLYQDQILGKVIDGVPAKYTQCGSSSPRRMYARSKPESWDSKNNYNNNRSHKKGLRAQWLTTLEASKTDIAALAVVGGLSKSPNKRTLLALGALVWIVGVSYDLAHAIEGEGLLLCVSRKE
jgi:hypothetical protein